MTRFFFWMIAVALTIGFGPRFFAVTITMARSAIHAHMHDQMSYAKFTQKLLTAKPRSKPKQEAEMAD